MPGNADGTQPITASQRLHAALRQAVEALDPDLRGVFRLRDMEKLSAAETAKRLLTSTSTVKLRLYRARKEICRQVWQHFQPAAAVGRTGRPPIARERARPMRLVGRKTRNRQRASRTLRGRAA